MRVTSKDIDYKPYVLSDVNVVELLISFRYKYDENMYLDCGSAFYVTGVKPLHEELILTYVALDETIKKCNFSKQQLRLIKMMEQGFTYREIEDELGIKIQNIDKSLKAIYKSIVDTNLREWRKVVYVNNLGLKTKQCSKCKEDLPATNEFFRDDSRNKSGLQSRCRSCEK